MAEESAITLPTLVSLLICDQVIDDRMTSKKSAIGLFNRVVAGRLPTRINQMAVMASLTEITHRTPIELRLVRDADNEGMLRTQGVVEAPNPLAVVDLVFAMQGVRLPSPGQYGFELLANGEVLGRRRFQVIVGKPPSGGGPETGDAGEPGG